MSIDLLKLNEAVRTDPSAFIAACDATYVRRVFQAASRIKDNLVNLNDQLDTEESLALLRQTPAAALLPARPRLPAASAGCCAAWASTAI